MPIPGRSALSAALIVLVPLAGVGACSSSSSDNGGGGTPDSGASRDSATGGDAGVNDAAAASDATGAGDGGGATDSSPGDDASVSDAGSDTSSPGDAGTPDFDAAAPAAGMANCYFTFDNPVTYSGNATPLGAPFIQATASGFAGGLNVTCSTGARTMMLATHEQTAGSYPSVPEVQIDTGKSSAHYAESGITWDSHGGSISIDSVVGKTLRFTLHAVTMQRAGTSSGDTFDLNGQGVATLQ